MLTRLYVDNYKALTSFELTLSNHVLLLGSNGSGKSSLFEVIEGLRRVLVDGESVDDTFSADTLTRWDDRRIQTYEIDATDGKSRYHYRLVVDTYFISHVIEESFSENDKTLLRARARSLSTKVALRCPCSIGARGSWDSSRC